MKKQNLNVDIDGDFKKETEIENKTCHFQQSKDFFMFPG